MPRPTIPVVPREDFWLLLGSVFKVVDGQADQHYVPSGKLPCHEVRILPPSQAYGRMTATWNRRAANLVSVAGIAPSTSHSLIWPQQPQEMKAITSLHLTHMETEACGGEITPSRSHSWKEGRKWKEEGGLGPCLSVGLLSDFCALNLRAVLGMPGAWWVLGKWPPQPAATD